jgi:hypothetical protein
VDETVAMKPVDVGKLIDGRITLALKAPAVLLVTLWPAGR